MKVLLLTSFLPLAAGFTMSNPTLASQTALKMSASDYLGKLRAQSGPIDEGRVVRQCNLVFCINESFLTLHFLFVSLTFRKKWENN
jgi:hypothetical protein